MLLSATPSIALTFNDNASFTTNATVGDVSYIANQFTVNASGLTGYTVKLSAMNGSGSELHGRDNATATIKPVANNTLPTAFADDTWGYSISTNTAAAPSSLAYNAMPAYGSPKDIYKKEDLTGAANEDSTYLLSFAAKFSTMSPADHYVGNFQLSVVPEAFVPTTYRLNFDANGGNANSIPANQEFTEEVLTASHQFDIPNTIPTRSGYAFMGWSKTLGGNADYAAGGKITLVKSTEVTVTLYAVWAQDTVYTLNYNANNGEGAPAAQSKTVAGDSTTTSYTFTIPNTKPTRSGYTFLGWAESNTATKASYQPNGSYTVQKSSPTKTLYAVWAQDTIYKVTFAANAGTDDSKVTNMPSGDNNPLTHEERGDSAATSYTFTIPNITPTRSGYTFQGWATTSTGKADYQPGDPITVQKGSSSTPTQPLYAVWRSNTIFNGITTMQAMNSTICSNAIEGDEAILTDTRDNNKYYVTKLADGNCWMTQNLAYGTVADTSIGTPCELSRSNNNPAVNDATCTNGTSWTNSYTDKYFAIGKHADGSHTSQGNYYNWQAAVQGTTGGTNIQGVCPTGWQLPISNASTTTNKSFNKLVTAYSAGNNAAGSMIMRSEPLYFQYSGSVGSGTLYLAGTIGYYWSSTMSSSSGAYSLGLDSSSANPSSDINYRDGGYSVRCVAK